MTTTKNADRFGVVTAMPRASQRFKDRLAREGVPTAKWLPGEEPSDYWRAEIIERDAAEDARMIAMYEDGCSNAEVMKELGMTKAAFEARVENDPDFKALVEYGETLIEAFWHKTGRRGVFLKTFNTPLYKFLAAHHLKMGTKDTKMGAPDDDDEVDDRNVVDLQSELKAILKRANGG